MQNERFRRMRYNRREALIASAALCVLAVALPAWSANLMRGPYLQLGTPTSVVVRWRTDVATDSRMRYGLSSDSLTANADDLTPTTEHQVTVTGLSANTRYYYSVGSTSAVLSAGADHFFVTSPAPGTSKPTRVWVLGDSGTANTNVLAVRDAYQTLAGARHTDLWLMLGDNAYSNGTDTEFQNAVFAMFPEMLRKSVLWPTRGNHEATDGSGSVYYQIFTMPQAGEAGGLASGTEKYYSFDYGNLHFICLDSQGSDRTPTGPMMTWLANDLAATNKDWIIAYWHHPPYSKGSHNSDTESQLIEMRQNALPILEAGGVDLVLAGHSHSYERSFLLDGHYGLSTTLTSSMKKDAGSGRPDGTGSYKKPTLGPASHQGAVYTVAGSSGQASGGALNHPAMFISLNLLGSLVLDVNGNTMDVKFQRENGGISDWFTMQKGPLGTTVPPAITGPASPLPAGMVNTSYAATFSASGDPAITWSVTGGALPPGMTLHATGVYSGKPTTPGTSAFTVRAANIAGSNSASYSHTIASLVQTPFEGTPRAMPGVIQVEDFDNGGEGLAYHDTTASNSGGKYRNTDVDLETNADGGAGFNLGWTAAGEWLEYTANVATAGTYNIEIRMASSGGGGTFHLEFDGVNKTGAIPVPSTGGWQTWQTLTIPGVSLNAGQQVLRVSLDTIGASGAVANFNYFNFIAITTAPAAPSGLVATAASSTQINLAWTDNSNNEDGFRIERSTDGANFSEIGTVGANVNTYADTGRAAATTYFYRVRSFNIGGNSGDSNVANATTLPNPPAAPSGLSATVASSTQINLAWTDNSNNNEDGFTIERSGDGTNFSEIAAVGANVTTYSNTGLSPATTYYYRVRAFNAGGNSAYSNTANATTPAGPPAAPSGLTATSVSKSQINLKWTDNANNETGFKIERSANGTTFAQVVQIATANQTTYPDTGLLANKRYYYRVRSYNAAGDSAYSNTATAKTKPK